MQPGAGNPSPAAFRTLVQVLVGRVAGVRVAWPGWKMGFPGLEPSPELEP